MARGGYHGKNPLDDSNVIATPKELNALTQNMLDNFLADTQRKPIDLHDTEDVKQAICNYLIDCQNSGKRPGNLGLYRALDLSKQDVSNILTGKSKSKASLEVIDLLKKAKQLLAEYREQLGSTGKLNPITLLFWQKNYDGLEDSTRLDITASRTQEPDLTPEQVAKQIEKDIPIDME